jgi:hypothetical protein
MNALPANTPSPNRSHDNVVTLPARRERRERDFGIGYGNSSGYASARRYVPEAGYARFRCA